VILPEGDMQRGLACHKKSNLTKVVFAWPCENVSAVSLSVFFHLFVERLYAPVVPGNPRAKGGSNIFNFLVWFGDIFE